MRQSSSCRAHSTGWLTFAGPRRASDYGFQRACSDEIHAVGRVSKAKRGHRFRAEPHGHAEPVIGPADGRTRWLCHPTSDFHSIETPSVRYFHEPEPQRVADDADG